MNAQSTSRICFRGLGNMGAKVIYLAGKLPEERRRFAFTSAVVLADDITKHNLGYLMDNGFLPSDIELFVEGDASTFSRFVGNRAIIRDVSEFKPSKLAVDVFVDFTFNATEFHSRLTAEQVKQPLVVQSNNYRQGVLWVPPMKQNKPENGVYRAADCSLGGAIPVLARLHAIFNRLGFTFITDRNAGKSAESPFDNTFYFSDSFPRRKSAEFGKLTRVPCLVSMVSSPVVNPFYLCVVSAIIDNSAVPTKIESWTKLERNGFAPLLRDSPRIQVCREDSTANHKLPAEPETIDEFARRYPDPHSVAYIVYFTRTFQRIGTDVAFKIGFDVNLTAAMSNVDLLEALSTD